jgi:hypothetical protein
MQNRTLWMATLAVCALAIVVDAGIKYAQRPSSSAAAAASPITPQQFQKVLSFMPAHAVGVALLDYVAERLGHPKGLHANLSKLGIKDSAGHLHDFGKFDDGSGYIFNEQSREEKPWGNYYVYTDINLRLISAAERKAGDLRPDEIAFETINDRIEAATLLRNELSFWAHIADSPPK